MEVVGGKLQFCHLPRILNLYTILNRAGLLIQQGARDKLRCYRLYRALC